MNQAVDAVTSAYGKIASTYQFFLNARRGVVEKIGLTERRIADEEAKKLGPDP